MSDYGKKHTCFNCGCKFYDLHKERIVCPKCKTDQKDINNKSSSTKGKLLTDVIGKKSSQLTVETDIIEADPAEELHDPLVEKNDIKLGDIIEDINV